MSVRESLVSADVVGEVLCRDEEEFIAFLPLHPAVNFINSSRKLPRSAEMKIEAFFGIDFLSKNSRIASNHGKGVVDIEWPGGGGGNCEGNKDSSDECSFTVHWFLKQI